MLRGLRNGAGITLRLQAITVMFLVSIGSSLVPKETLRRQVSSSFAGRRLRTEFLASRIHRSFVTRSRITMMPEGPEVRTLTDQLQGGVGRRLVSFEILSGRYARNGPPVGWQDFKATLTNTSAITSDNNNVDIIQEWNCKGKFIYILLDPGRQDPSPLSSSSLAASNTTDFQRSIWVTLGMTGRFLNEAAHQADNRWARWYLELENIADGKRNRLYYHDARNFGTIKFVRSREELATKLGKLGPDLLSMATTETDFCNILSAQKPERNICKILMDQTKLAGIGNYILAEGAYRAGIDPFASVSELSEVQQRMLFRQLREVATESYTARGMTRKEGGMYRNVDGNRGQFEFQLQCYGRENCARGKPVFKDTNGPHGRTIWYTNEQLFMPRTQRAEATLAMSKSNPDDEASTRITDPSPELTAADSDQAIATLLAGLTEPSWKVALADALSSDSFQQLASFLQEEQANGVTVYPPLQEIFTAFNLCPLEKVKVVIVGQDPYHGPGQGHGLAFSVRKGLKPPPSLQNVFREVMADVGIAEPSHGNLEHWGREGVLLLNTVLSVRRGEANSHAKRGWEDFTDCVIKELNEHHEGLVFLLWGNPAAKKAGNIDPKHTVIRTSHPSPLGATKTSTPFLGSRCFSRTNAALALMGKDPIDWNNVD